MLRFNPYDTKRGDSHVETPPPNDTTTTTTATAMGPQSQNRKNLNTRTRLATAKRKGLQQSTIIGGIAFSSEKDCEVCSPPARGLPKPHRKHHKLCNWKDTMAGPATGQAAIDLENAECLRQHLVPLTNKEKGDG